MSDQNVLVTGIGGNVAHGIMRNIRKHFPELKIIGTSIVEFSGGNFLCDRVHVVPHADNEDYIDKIIDIVNAENIALIIPSTDLEIWKLSQHRSRFSAIVSASASSSCRRYFDKFESYQAHQQHKTSFAETVLPSHFNGRFQHFICKPRFGRGSRQLYFNPPDVSRFSDDEFIIQKSYFGIELTSAFYVTKTNELHGLITLERTLQNGATAQCLVNDQYDLQLKEIIHSMMLFNDFRGSVNIQSIVSDNKVIPFEVNCRISGTNSIRGQLGFEDVKYTVQEYLFNEQPDAVNIRRGGAVRILMDVIYLGAESENDLRNPTEPPYLF